MTIFEGHNNNMRITLLLLLNILIFAGEAFTQTANAELRRGNKSFNDGQFQDAEMYYRRGLEKLPLDVRGLYNLSNSLYRQGRFDEASNILEGLSGMEIDAAKRADILHNLGNARMGEQKINEGIEAYKESLRIRPDDAETRHNLAYALRLLQQQQQQQQQQSQDEQNQENDNRQQPPSPNQAQGNQGQEQPQQSRLTPQDAERMLNALNKQEQNIQERIDRNEKNIVPSRVLRDW